MVILPVAEVTTTSKIALGVSGSMMIGLVEEPRTVRLPPPPSSIEIHLRYDGSLKRTGPDPYFEKE
jgi:hypothetical protein